MSIENYAKINLIIASENPNENWMEEKLKRWTKLKWVRQHIHKKRIYDFWNEEKGIAIEVDGKSHKKDYDDYRDKKNYEEDGILVLRVKNMNVADACAAIQRVNKECSWQEREAILAKSPTII